MPPAITSENEEDSDVGDIPYVAPKGKPADKEQLALDLEGAVENGADEDDDGDDDDDEDGEDEYTVEKILSHAFEKNGSLKYQVSWVGWSEPTWEPEENLNNCPEEIDVYNKSIGGRPQFKKTKAKVGPVSATKKKNNNNNNNNNNNKPAQESPAVTTRKRKPTQDSPAVTPPASTALTVRGRKKTKVAERASEDGSEAEAGKAPLPSGSWEDEVRSVETMTRNGDGMLLAYVSWNEGGAHSQHPALLLRRKCPMKLIDFYEAHLQFNPPKVKQAPYDEARIVDITDEIDNKEEVKPVASDLEE